MLVVTLIEGRSLFNDRMIAVATESSRKRVAWMNVVGEESRQIRLESGVEGGVGINLIRSCALIGCLLRSVNVKIMEEDGWFGSRVALFSCLGHEEWKAM